MPRRGREGRAQAARAAQGACSRRRRSTPSRAPTSSGWSSCRGRSSTEDKLDIQEARDILDADHYDLEKVKKRILEYLAVRKLKSDKKGPILCLVGPARRRQDLARPLDRARDGPQVRAHLARRRARRGGDPRPPAHLRRRAAGPHHPGHEEGRDEQPGLHARRDRQARARLPRRPGGGAARGARPRAEQHLLAITTSRCRSTCRRCMFIATANIIDPIPPALRDRLEVLELPGYTREEKLQHRAAVPRAEAARGARPHDRAAARSPTTRSSEVIDSYTREAGVRNLEREIGQRRPRGRGAGRRGQGQGARDRSPPSAIAEFLGPQKFMSEVAERTAEPGVATGLAWTPVGGDILFIEATQDARQGQAGAHRPARRRDEGVGAGGAVVRARASAKWLGLEENFLEKTDIHVHIPAGADPQGRPVGGRHDVHRAGVAADRQAGAAATWR